MHPLCNALYQQVLELIVVDLIVFHTLLALLAWALGKVVLMLVISTCCIALHPRTSTPKVSMSQVHHETTNTSSTRIGNDTKSLVYARRSHLPRPSKLGNDESPPQSAQNEALHNSMSNFVDGSGPIFSMYLEMATEEDKKMVEDWKADADGILIFVRPRC